MAQQELCFPLSLFTMVLPNYSSLMPSTLRKGRPDYQKEERCLQWRAVGSSLPDMRIHKLRKASVKILRVVRNQRSW